MLDAPYCVRHNKDVEIRFTQAARRHRIGRAHALHVMSTYVPEAVVTTRGDAGSQWIGNDDRGIELHIIAVEQPDRKSGEAILLVTHVMPTALKKGESQ
jgi:hypothetical protein